MTVASAVKGWCPGAFAPMMSGDGLIVRVRPFYARLDAVQVLGLCDLAREYGNGMLDLTNRANLQIRGVTEQGLDGLVAALGDLDLLDATPALESRRNTVITPFWCAGDVTERLYAGLLQSLMDLPDLPAKFGFAIDTGAQPTLGQASADIRIERGAHGLIVRADGAVQGRAVSEHEAIPAVHELTRWFAAHRQPQERRMERVLARTGLPDTWTQETPLGQAPVLHPGAHRTGAVLGAPFGQIEATALARVVRSSGASALRVTPWRLFVLEGVTRMPSCDFVTRADDPLLNIDACPGAPHCASATVRTRDLARQLAAQTTGSLHISGCTKGCARKGPAETTFVGNQGCFDLVPNGHAWDAPEKSGLRAPDILAELAGPR